MIGGSRALNNGSLVILSDDGSKLLMIIYSIYSSLIETTNTPSFVDAEFVEKVKSRMTRKKNAWKDSFDGKLTWAEVDDLWITEITEEEEIYVLSKLIWRIN